MIQQSLIHATIVIGFHARTLSILVLFRQEPDIVPSHLILQEVATVDLGSHPAIEVEKLPIFMQIDFDWATTRNSEELVGEPRKGTNL